MPEYSFYCDECSNSFSEFWSISLYEDKLKSASCPKCNSSSVYRNYSEDNMVVSYHEITTIGQLAEKNTKKMGKYKLEEKRREDNMDLYKKNKEASAKRRKLNKMTPAQKAKWIMEGD